MTHVPPRAAFNDGTERRWVVAETEDGDMVERGRAREGGLRVFGHCEACHRATNPWDDEYIAWARGRTAGLVQLARAGKAPHPGGEPVAMQFMGRPGRFIRAALAGMGALAEDLYQTHPDLCTAVRTGQPAEMPTDLRFLIGLTPTVERAVVQGLHRGMLVKVPVRQRVIRDPVTGLHVVGGRSEPAPAAVIHFPPFSLVLVSATVAERYRHADHSDWLKSGADEPPRQVAALWPVVRLRHAQQITCDSFT